MAFSLGRLARSASRTVSAAQRMASDLSSAGDAWVCSERGPGDAVAFLGLGAMGYPMAANLRASTSTVYVWNRSNEITDRHTKVYGTRPLSADFGELSSVRAAFLCLPTSIEVEATLRQAAPTLRRGTVVVDCTSGHPQETKRIAEWLMVDHGILMMDCAVSGGPSGASKGTLSAFVGCDEPEVVRALVPDIETFAENIVHLGPVGSGHAVKAINNAMNVSNLLTASEGLLALRKLGIDPGRALSVINKSSGRSLMSEQRMPQDVVSGWFNYGFKLGLMRKDVSIANDLLDEHFPGASIIRNTARLMDDALAMDELNADSDYTQVVKILEQQAGADLRSHAGQWEWKKHK